MAIYNTHQTGLPAGGGIISTELARFLKESRSRVVNRTAGQRVKSYPGGQTVISPVVTQVATGSVVAASQPPVWR